MNNLLFVYYFLTLLGISLICDGRTFSISAKRQNGRIVYTYNGKDYPTQEAVMEQIKRENPGVIFGTSDSPSNQNNNGGYNRNNGYTNNGGGNNPQSFTRKDVTDLVGNNGYSSEVFKSIWKDYNADNDEKNGYKNMKERMLNESNEYRKHHRAPPLEINSTLAEMAQKYAEKLASTGIFAHDPNNRKDRTGENLGFGSALNIAATVVKLWYDENEYYDYGSKQYNPKAGHFTQLVWKESTKAGFGVAKGSKGYYVVCKYQPPGNVIGFFDQNVLKR
uniref:SCP domain-containing protein n=1 Tax=Strongyloides papillosus TaxID=174720 RepID=A0A0N5BKX2_STREA